MLVPEPVKVLLGIRFPAKLPSRSGEKSPNPLALFFLKNVIYLGNSRLP
jgi:hypothetical protein